MTRPVESPIASSALRQKVRSGAASGPDSTAKVFPVRSTEYVTAKRLDLINSGLSPLDRTVLAFLSETRIATSRQLMRLFWQTREDNPGLARSGRRALQRLADWRVLDRLPRTIGGARAGSDGHVYCIGVAGAKILARRGLQVRRPGVPGDRYVAHTLAVAELVVALREADRRSEIDLIETQTEPRCWRSFIAGFGDRATVKPDAFLRIGAGAFEDRYFVEIDMATEASNTIHAKAKRYLAHLRSGAEQAEHGVYPRVLWAVPSVARAEQLAGVLAAGPETAKRLFLVCLQADVPGYLAGEAGR